MLPFLSSCMIIVFNLMDTFMLLSHIVKDALPCWSFTCLQPKMTGSRDSLCNYPPSCHSFHISLVTYFCYLLPILSSSVLSTRKFWATGTLYQKSGLSRNSNLTSIAHSGDEGEWTDGMKAHFRALAWGIVRGRVSSFTYSWHLGSWSRGMGGELLGWERNRLAQMLSPFWFTPGLQVACNDESQPQRQSDF